MFVGFYTFELLIPHANSLKEKRNSLRSLKERLKKLNVSFQEEENDLWQRTLLGVAFVSENESSVSAMFNEVIKLIEEYPEIQILNSKMEVF
jgi:uncharacterized protein YlxP (DUF503 family)